MRSSRHAPSKSIPPPPITPSGTPALCAYPRFLFRGDGVGRGHPTTTTTLFSTPGMLTLENENQPGCLFLGAAAQVPTLDGRVLRLPCPEVVSPGYERRLAAEGMPISKNPGSRGDLLIRFKLVFPAFLPQASKVDIAYTYEVVLCPVNYIAKDVTATRS